MKILFHLFFLVAAASAQTCDCGKNKYESQKNSCNGRGIANRIVNGDFAQQGEYPWQVALTACINPNSCFACGGTIINHRYILTAMHCVNAPNGVHFISFQIKVGVGEHDKYSKEAPPKFKEFKVAQIIRRSDYNQGNKDNDIALLKLAEDIEFNEDVQPICLPDSKFNDYTRNWGVVTGWGKTSFNGISSHVLKKAGLEVISNKSKYCVVGALGWGALGMEYPGQEKICGYNEGTDSCQGDSGGPLVYEENGRCTQIGVVSYGHECAKIGHAGVYARVTNYLEWIKENAKDGGCM